MTSDPWSIAHFMFVEYMLPFLGYLGVPHSRDHGAAHDRLGMNSLAFASFDCAFKVSGKSWQGKQVMLTVT